MNGYPDVFRVKAEDFSAEFPAPDDGVMLEVVAEAEVAEHLEESEVAVGATDFVQIVVLAARSHALLNAHRSRPRSSLFADEIRLEGNHPCHSEKQARIVRHEIARRHFRMPSLCEKPHELLAQLLGFHSVLILSAKAIRLSMQDCQCDGVRLYLWKCQAELRDVGCW